MERRSSIKNKFKKSTYFFLFCFVTGLILFCIKLFSTPENATPDHVTISLTPYTAREQKDLIKTQEQEDQLDVAGPLVSLMNASEAQARVLNVVRDSKQNSHS